MLRASNVTKMYGRRAAVADATLDVSPGESVALWGPNGAGKTTLLRCALGLARFRGVITVGGHDVRKHGKRARMLIGYVPQELGFYDELRVHEAVVFFGGLKGMRCVRVREVLERVGLGGEERKRIRELSGGMKQRLALAIALLGDPPVLILDEVTASLDAVGRGEFVGLLERLSGSGRTMLFASHRVEEIGALAARVAVLDKGRIVRIDSRDAFVSSMGYELVLHVFMESSAHEYALRTLRDNGFAAERNGQGVLVPVDSERKAAPLRALAQAGIRVDDFEIVTVSEASGLAHGGRERGR